MPCSRRPSRDSRRSSPARRTDLDVAAAARETDGTFLGDGGDAAAVARDVDDFAADVVRAHPGRFGFATLPLPDVDAALAEIDRTFDVLGADGVVLLAHAGGFLPYAAYRLATAASPRGDALHGLELLRRYWFDVALSSSPSALPSLLSFATPGQVTFGSDVPYAPEPVGTAFLGMLTSHALDDDTRASIDRGAADVLFPRLAAS